MLTRRAFAAHLRRPQDDIATYPGPTAAAVKRSRLFGGVLELWAVATTSMPQRNDLNRPRGISVPREKRLAPSSDWRATSGRLHRRAVLHAE